MTIRLISFCKKLISKCLQCKIFHREKESIGFFKHDDYESDSDHSHDENVYKKSAHVSVI